MSTIRGRLLGTLLLGLVVVLTAGGAGIFWLAGAGLVRQLDAELATRARTIAALVTYEDGRLQFDADPIQPETDGYFEIRTLGGELLRPSRNLGDGRLPVRRPGNEGPEYGDIVLPGDAAGRATWMAFRPRLDDDEDEGAVGAPEVLIVGVAVDRAAVDATQRTLLGSIIAVGSAVAITAGLLTWFGVRWGLALLDRLSNELTTVGGKTLSTRLDGAGVPRELVCVYSELNRMLDRVEATLERERSFVSAAAHELRTPLAELRTTAEVALRFPDSESATTTLSELLAVGVEMERMVESLLLISRGHAAERDAADTVAMGPIVDACVRRANGTIDDKPLAFTVDLHHDDTMHVPRGAVEIIVRNLIDNAITYTPAHGSVHVSGERGEDGAVSLVVENGPVALQEDDLLRLFEPFWQSDRSRHDRQHVGLGLTVVQRMARAIGLRIETALVGGRLRISVRETVASM